jgi:hypothetical protein
MSREKGHTEPESDIEPRPQAEVVDFAQAKIKFARQSRPEQPAENRDFETEKRTFLERTRESLTRLRTRAESQSADMKKKQNEIDSRRMMLGQTSVGIEIFQRSLRPDGDKDIRTGFEIFERNLKLAEQIDNAADWESVRQSFQDSLAQIEKSLDEQERVLGRIPQRELDTMPEAVRREALEQQRVADTFLYEFQNRLEVFRTRLNLIKGLVNPEAVSKLESGISQMETIISTTKIMPGLKRLEYKPQLEASFLKVDQAIQKGETASKSRR